MQPERSQLHTFPALPPPKNNTIASYAGRAIAGEVGGKDLDACYWHASGNSGRSHFSSSHFGSRLGSRAYVFICSNPWPFALAHGMTPLLALFATSAAWAASRGWEGVRATASLPPTCRQAVAHAALVCSGVEPVCFSAGCGPFSLVWGWLLLGLVLGALLRSAVDARVLCALRARGHSAGSTLAARALAPAVWRCPSRRGRRGSAVEVLRCVAQGGHDELHALAASAGLTPAALTEALATRAPDPNDHGVDPATSTPQPRGRRSPLAAPRVPKCWAAACAHVSLAHSLTCPQLFSSSQAVHLELSLQAWQPPIARLAASASGHWLPLRRVLSADAAQQRHCSALVACGYLACRGHGLGSRVGNGRWRPALSVEIVGTAEGAAEAAVAAGPAPPWSRWSRRRAALLLPPLELARMQHPHWACTKTTACNGPRHCPEQTCWPRRWWRRRQGERQAPRGRRPLQAWRTTPWPTHGCRSGPTSPGPSDLAPTVTLHPTCQVLGQHPQGAASSTAI